MQCDIYHRILKLRTFSEQNRSDVLQLRVIVESGVRDLGTSSFLVVVMSFGRGVFEVVVDKGVRVPSVVDLSPDIGAVVNFRSVCRVVLIVGQGLSVVHAVVLVISRLLLGVEVGESDVS